MQGGKGWAGRFSSGFVFAISIYQPAVALPRHLSRQAFILHDLRKSMIRDHGSRWSWLGEGIFFLNALPFPPNSLGLGDLNGSHLGDDDFKIFLGLGIS